MSYTAGIIGSGGIAGLGILGMHDEETLGEERSLASHAGGYQAVDGIQAVTVADVDDGQLEQFGDVWDIPAERRYTDHLAMLEAEDLDAVSVCTPTYLHADHVLDAVEVGDPDVVWCEKPIASSVTDAEAMISACDAADVELVVNHSFRFTDKLQVLRDHIEDWLIGSVEAVSAQFRRELLRNSTHLLDTLVYLLDVRAATVSGYLNDENDAVKSLDADREVDDSGGGGLVVMQDGTFVTVDCTVAREISSMTIQLIGDEGKLYLNNDDGEWRYWRLADGEHHEEPIPGIDGAWSWDADYRSAFPNAVEHIVDLLEGTATNRSSGEQALRSLEIIIGFYVSHATGSHVSIPLARPLRDVTVTSW